MTTVETELVAMSCGVCGIPFAMPASFQRERKELGGQWFCPNGHPRVYRESDLKIAQRELAQARSRLDQVEAEKAKVEKDLKKAKKQTACGQCPVCERSFRSLRTHMTNKHPEYVAETAK